jgi:predicted nucleic acid-binding protein
MFLLDTNVVSELRKARAGRADKNVATWAAGAPVASMFVSVITIQELEMGAALLRDGSKSPRSSKRPRSHRSVAVCM